MKLSMKEQNVIKSLLQVAESGWYSDEVLPDGIKTVAEAEQIVKQLQSKGCSPIP